MPQVYRISEGEKVSIFISDPIWARMQKRPNVFSKYKWELVPQSPKNIKKESPITKPPIDNISVPSKYGEKEYRRDLGKAKILVTKGDKENAKLLYEKAYLFKKSGYVKGQINKL